MPIPFESASLGDVSEIQTRYFLGRTSQSKGGRILLIKYDGECRSGDAGEFDGRFMLATGTAGLTAWEPDGLILDLSGLGCTRLAEGLGSLLAVGQGVFGTENMPQAVIVGPRCERAIRDYYLPLNSGCKSEAVREYFYGIEEATDFIQKELIALQLAFTRKS